jgi:hypothetical protein
VTNSNESGVDKQKQSDEDTESGLDIKWVDITETSDNTTELLRVTETNRYTHTGSSKPTPIFHQVPNQLTA